MMFGRGYNGLSNCFGLGGSGYMHGGWGMIIMAAIIIIAIIAVVYLVKKTSRYKTDNVSLEALKMRYAKGEISEEEYAIKKSILE